MEIQFKQLIALARKTGDPLIVLGTESEEACVILSVSRYEALIDGVHVHPPLPPAAPPPPRPMPTASELPLPPESAASEQTETQFYLEPVE